MSDTALMTKYKYVYVFVKSYLRTSGNNSMWVAGHWRGVWRRRNVV